jgi:hypothetical protein|tara:strand:- start:1406 stop:1921 length:516 start_codon:yes stop_codon:yes gene_type:complete
MAQKALFITINDLKRKSIIDGNVDADKLIQFIEVAQDTHIQNYLGGLLYEKLQALILAGTIDDAGNSNYKLLLDDYVKPMLTWFTQSSYLPFAMYQISNGGVFKHRSENSETISLEEMRMMLAKVTETAEFYTRRFVDYMDYNSTLYPEYVSSTNGEMYPDKDVNFNSWVL